MPISDWRIVTATAIVLAESGGNPLIVSKPNWSPGKPTHLSIDMGLYQLNSFYQVLNNPYPSIPKIPWQDVFDPFKAFEHVWKLITMKGGWAYDWSAWSAYTNGSYQKHVSAAYQGLTKYRAAAGYGPLL